MTCPACAAPITSGHRFCTACGVVAVAGSACGRCGLAADPGARFCGGCGAPLGADGPAGPARHAAAGWGSAVPGMAQASGSHAAGAAATPGTAGTSATPATGSRPGTPGTDAAHASPHARPVAERRVVTVLFADLVGFTTFSEGRDAEAVREMLSHYFEMGREIIARHGGTVEKFIGDAVMAVWGAPVAREDDAERAVRAALELVDAIPELGRTAGVALAVRAGVLTGEAAVTVGAIDQGIVTGDLVNTAARLQSVAPPGGVLVGEPTRTATEHAIVYEPAGEQTLKGKAAPVAAWLARRVGGDRGDALEPPFVGRADELRLLKEQLHATGRERTPRIVSIVGQGGIGKSRLALELERYIEGVVEPVWWHRGRSPSYGDEVTCWALGEMVRQRAGLAEGADADATRQAVDGMLARHLPSAEERAWVGPALLVLLGIGTAPPGGRDELFAAWRTLFERISSDGTVALVFEDLQWADDGLLDFIEHLLDWARDRPIIVITLARPELLDRRPGWGTDRRGARSIRLEPLGAAAMRELLEGIVPGLPADAAGRIVDRADGIPLYAVETVRMLLSSGRLVAQDGRIVAADDLGDIDVPPSLHALVAARLDALPPADRALVADGAVLGLSFTAASLAALTGEPADGLAPRLAALVRREILVVETDPRSPTRGRHAFVQEIVREVAYGTLSRKARRERHLAAARHFEGLGDEELAGMIATHYLAAWRASPDDGDAAAVADRARTALVAAADRAERLGGIVQAAAALESALEVTPVPAERARLLERIGTLQAYATRVDDAERTLDEAIASWQAIGDEAGVLRSVSMWAANQMAAGRLSRAAERLDAELARATAAGAAGDPALGSAAATFGEAVARIAFRTGRFDDALEWCDRTLAIAERLRLEPVIAEVLVTKGTVLVLGGHRREGSALLVGALANARERGLHLPALRAATNLSSTVAATDPRAGVALTREVIETSHRLGLRSYDAFSASNALAAIATGEWAWLRSVLQEMRDAAVSDEQRGDFDLTIALAELWATPIDATLLDRWLAQGRAEEDFQTVAISLATIVDVAYATGNDRTAVAHGLELCGLPFGRELTSAATAARLAARLGDRAAYERIVGALDLPGGASELELELARATLDAVDGRTAAATERFRRATEQARTLGLRFVIAWCGLAMAEALPAGTPGLDVAVVEARAILDELGATLLLRRLDAATAATPPG